MLMTLPKIPVVAQFIYIKSHRDDTFVIKNHKVNQAL